MWQWRGVYAGSSTLGRRPLQDNDDKTLSASRTDAPPARTGHLLITTLTPGREPLPDTLAALGFSQHVPLTGSNRLGPKEYVRDF